MDAHGHQGLPENSPEADKQVYSSYDIDTVYPQHRRHRLPLQMVRFLDGSKYCLPQCHNYYWPGYRHFQAPDLSPARCNCSQPAIAKYRHTPLLLVYYADPNRPTRLDSRQDFAEDPQLSSLGVYLDPDTVWQHPCKTGISACLVYLRFPHCRQRRRHRIPNLPRRQQRRAARQQKTHTEAARAQTGRTPPNRPAPTRRRCTQITLSSGARQPETGI